jgi:hypothetical protein
MKFEPDLRFIEITAIIVTLALVVVLLLFVRWSPEIFR